MFSKVALTSVALLAFARASEITIQPLPAGCSSLPGYDATSGNAGPWSFTTSGASDPSLNNLGLGSYYDIEINPIDPRGSRFINVARLTVNTHPDQARLPFNCANDTINVYTQTDLDPSNWELRNVSWTPVVTEWIYNFGGPTHSGPSRPGGALILTTGDKPVMYEHYVDGVKQEGLFLGGYNTSTWGISWEPASKASFTVPYFWARLVLPGAALWPNETTTYIQIQ